MIEKAQAIELFRQMLLIRRFEEAVIDLWSKVEVEGHRHVYIGQEAVAAAVMSQLRSDDFILTTHRNHGHMVARGVDPGRLLAEILGRMDGFNGSRGGSSGVTCREAGFLATTNLVGGAVGLGIGGALAQKVRGGDGITVTFFGDGGLEEGIAFESMNMAALFKLPTLFICENNSVGVTTGRAENEWSSSSMSAATLGDIPRSLQIQTSVIDSADLETVMAAVASAVSWIRAGNGPAFIESRTRRWPGSRSFHPKLVTGVTDLGLVFQPGTSSGEHAWWIDECDPVLLFGRKLVERGQLDRDELLAMDAACVEIVRGACDFALSSPMPTPESGLAGTFA